MATHPNVLRLTLNPKLTYSTHIHNTSVHAHKPLQIIKALTATAWDKQTETLMATSINKRKVMYNAALKTATGCTQDTNIQYMHDETLTLPIQEHLQLHASQFKQKTQDPSHPPHKHTTYFNTPRLNTLSSTTPAAQQHSHRTPHSHYNIHTYKQTCAIYTHLLSLGI